MAVALPRPVIRRLIMSVGHFMQSVSADLKPKLSRNYAETYDFTTNGSLLTFSILRLSPKQV